MAKSSWGIKILRGCAILFFGNLFITMLFFVGFKGISFLLAIAICVLIVVIRMPNLLKALGRAVAPWQRGPENEREHALVQWAESKDCTITFAKRGPWMMNRMFNLLATIPLQMKIWKQFKASLPASHSLRKKSIQVLSKSEAFQWRRFLEGHPEWELEVDRKLAGFFTYCLGVNGFPLCIIEGTWAGRHYLAFDYQYRETSGSNSKATVIDISGVAIKAPCPLKPLTIRTENTGDKIAAVFGFSDIEFASEEFNKKFHITADDRKWAYDILHALTMEHLLAHPDYLITFDLDYIIAYQVNQYTPDQFQTASTTLSTFLDLIPDYVIDQQNTTTEE